MAKPAQQHKRPKIVTIGGGTGHFALLSGLKKHDVDITAIVTMSDDGGSTGLLRDELGVLPPGDLRQCLVALSEGDELMRKLFTHRFSNGSLKGHTFGNLFLSTLERITGSIDDAVAEAGSVLKIRGSVVPVTLKKTKVVTKLNNGKVLRGEHAVSEYLLVSKFGVKDMHLSPEAHIHPLAAQAIKDADLIVIGPGNLYASLVPNLLVTGLPQALRRTKAPKVFVANLMNKHGHADGFSCGTYAQELEKRAGTSFLDIVLYNTAHIPTALVKKYVDEGEPVRCDSSHNGKIRFVGADLLSTTRPKQAKGDPLRRTLIRHDPDQLAKAIMDLLPSQTR